MTVVCFDHYNISPVNKICNQESIPVGCVPPAAVAVRGSRHTPRTRPPLDQAPPQEQAPPQGAGTPPDQPPPVDRHTSVNILLCPKLRLRAVIINLCRFAVHAVTRFFWCSLRIFSPGLYALLHIVLSYSVLQIKGLLRNLGRENILNLMRVEKT